MRFPNSRIPVDEFSLFGFRLHRLNLPKKFRNQFEKSTYSTKDRAFNNID